MFGVLIFCASSSGKNLLPMIHHHATATESTTASCAAANAGRRMAVFFHEPLLGKGYQFVGVFKTNLEKSRKRLFHVFDRVSDELEV